MLGRRVFMKSGMTYMGFVVVLMLISGTSRGQEIAGGKPLQKWGYCLLESLEKEPLRKEIEAAVKDLNVLSVTGYKLGKEGRVHGPSPEMLAQIESLARKGNVEVLPLVAFTSRSDGRMLLASPVSRKRAVEELAALGRSKVYAGLHLDFEYLPPEDAQGLAAFLGELRPALGGRRLTMAVFPPVDFPRKWSEFHNLDLIVSLLDEIVLMCYDAHRPGTPAGPVVDMEWAKRNITRVLESVRPEKVWLGVPAYGYDWTGKGRARVVSARDAARLGEKHHAVRHASGNLYFHYRDQAGTHEVYVADRETRKRMEALAASFNLRGTALWRLGFEER